MTTALWADRPPLQAMLFDLDHTLYPRTAPVAQLIQDRMNEYVCRLVGCDLETAIALRREYLRTYGTTMHGLEQHYQIDVEEYMRFIHDMEMAGLLDRDHSLDAYLTRLQLPKAIFTNAPLEHAERVLEALGIAQHFVRIFDIRFMQFRPKPHDAGYLAALAELGVEARACIFLEDTAQNLGPARRLGMRTVLIGEDACADADVVVPRVHDALELLLQAV